LFLLLILMLLLLLLLLLLLMLLLLLLLTQLFRSKLSPHDRFLPTLSLSRR